MRIDESLGPSCSAGQPPMLWASLRMQAHGRRRQAWVGAHVRRLRWGTQCAGLNQTSSGARLHARRRVLQHPAAGQIPIANTSQAHLQQGTLTALKRGPGRRRCGTACTQTLVRSAQHAVHNSLCNTRVPPADAPVALALGNRPPCQGPPLLGAAAGQVCCRVTDLAEMQGPPRRR